MSIELHRGDVGTVLTATVTENGVAANISTATTKEFVFQKPSGTVVSKIAVFVTDGADGKLKYTTVANDLDEEGTWSWQVRLVFPAGEWRTSVVNFTVGQILI